MAELVLTDVDDVVLDHLRERAVRHGRTPAQEAKAILAEAVPRGSGTLNAIVVDASVGLKWFVPEVHATEARQWRSGPHELHVPAFFFDLEIANVLWKKCAGTRDQPCGCRFDSRPTPRTAVDPAPGSPFAHPCL